MIKVIKPRSSRNVECVNCGALLSYEIADVKEDFYYKPSERGLSIFRVLYKYITCPECGEEIRLGRSVRS